MRCTAADIQAINTVVHTLDARARLVLCGSRVDETTKGGAIALLMLSSTLEPRETRTIRRGLCRALGEQPCDLVMAHETSRPLLQMALAEGEAR